MAIGDVCNIDEDWCCQARGFLAGAAGEVELRQRSLYVVQCVERSLARSSKGLAMPPAEMVFNDPRQGDAAKARL